MNPFRRRKAKDDPEDIIEGELEDIDPAERAKAAQARRTHATQQDVPLERVAPNIPTPDETVISEFVRHGEKKRRIFRPRFRLPRLPHLPSLPRLIVWSEVRPGLLFLALGLVFGGVFWTLHNLGETSENADGWWPLVLLVFALIWAVSSLIQRQITAFLAAITLTGISISLLMDAQDLIRWQESLIGTVLITIGIGIIARGLLLRQGATA